MFISIHEARADRLENLLPILLLAEPSESALRWSLENLSDTIYQVNLAEEIVGAATISWQAEPAEIVELAVVNEFQGKGIGKRIVEWLIAEAGRRGKQKIVVGTANSSLDNIAFYQKCGFRMDHIRQDYFWYHSEPVFEHGIEVRDMIVFRYDIQQTRSSDE